MGTLRLDNINALPNTGGGGGGEGRDEYQGGHGGSGIIILRHSLKYKDGEDFEEYLRHYNHGTMILNIKSERIEFNVLKLLKKYGIKKYFFLAEADIRFVIPESLCLVPERPIFDPRGPIL